MDIIDDKKLEALYGDKETSLDIIHMYVDQAPQFLDELENAIENDDPSILAKVCHKGVGQARYIASPIIEETLIDLQKADKEKKGKYLEEFKELLNKLINEHS